MVEKLDAKRVSLSLAAISGVLSVICALFIAIAPQFTMRFFGTIFHGIDLSKIQKTMTFSDAVLGVVAAVILALIIGWLFAKIYNSIK